MPYSLGKNNLTGSAFRLFNHRIGQSRIPHRIPLIVLLADSPTQLLPLTEKPDREYGPKGPSIPNSYPNPKRKGGTTIFGKYGIQALYKPH